MPLVIPTGFCQITFEFSIPTPGGIKLAYSTCGSGIAGDDTLADTIHHWRSQVWDLHLSGDTADNVSLLRVIGTTETEELEETVFEAGTRSGATSPPNVSSLVQKRSALRGRQHHGRMYWPGLLNDSEVADDGSIDATRFTNLSESWTAIWTGLVAVETQPFILHNSATDPTPVTSFTFSPVIATQRRRLKRP